MKTPIPGKYTMDANGNRVPVYAEEPQEATPVPKAARAEPAPAASPADEPANPVTPSKKRSPK